MKYLVIVESPNKIKTLENIFKGQKDEFKVIATAGHILDLDKKNMGVDLTTFEPSYVPIPDKHSIIANLTKTYKSFNPDVVLLAGDIDFEGTFINWSVKTILKLNKPRTLEFIALTKDDVLKALKKETYINPHHLDAQQTRRILDRVCGFSITGELFKLYGGNVSAGRVQSVVSKLIIDKEDEIEEWFKEKKDSFYEAKCESEYGEGKYEVNLLIEDKDDLEDFKITPYKITDKTSRDIISHPTKPFNTSSLQQKANTLFHLSSTMTMNILQSLFTKGLITYHRTTSVVLSDECLNMCKEYIVDNYGSEYYQKRVFKDSSDNSENSHEAIRHTTNILTPKNITSTELKVYQLIFTTTIQSQMKDKITNELKIKYSNDAVDNFITTANKITFAGFEVMKENKDDSNYPIIESLKVGDEVKVNKITFKEKYANPPPRYSEATLISKLSPKNLNIGRPSTYASIIDKIIKRGYVKIDNIEGNVVETKDYVIENGETKEESSKFAIGNENNKFIPTELGRKVVNFMNENFSNIMDYHFTADLEHKLDLIGDNKLSKLSTLTNFYDELKIGLDKTKEFVKENKKGNVVGIRDGQDIILKGGRYGEYIEWNKMKISCKEADNTISDTNERYNNLIDAKLNEHKDVYHYGKDEISIKKGKYGCYFTFNKKNYSIKEDEISDEKIKEIIEAKESNVLKKVGKYEIVNGPYGPYFKYGKKFISVKDDLESLTIDKINELIEGSKKKRYYKKK